MPDMLIFNNLKMEVAGTLY